MAHPCPEDFAQALERYLPDSASLETKDLLSHEADRQGPPSLNRLPIQSVLDLHGQSLVQARRSVDHFLKQSADRGLRKVLIIHGKGSGILQAGIARYLEGHPLAGQRRPARREDGGNGALVVILKQK